MIIFLGILSFMLSIGYTFVFFEIVKTFLPLRKNMLLKVAAFVVCTFLADSIIYSNDLASLLGTMVFFLLYLLIFYQGNLTKKMSVLLVFYPALIAINYLMLDIGGRIFFNITHTTYADVLYSPKLTLISAAIHTLSLLLRLLFWVGAWWILRKHLSKITSHLNTKMWLIIDMLTMASFIAIFTIIYFMPENAALVYPICGASIFSSFGCMYLASYICNSIQTSYRAQELEIQRNYYKDRMKDEERVRSVYHDLKNHLLVLRADIGNNQDVLQSIETLQNQIVEYENYQHTGNEYLDIILRDKARVAHEKQIDFTALIHFEAGVFIEPLDISTIFGNALDNAIEASEKLPVGKRIITVKAANVRDMIVVTIENNAADTMQKDRRTTKIDDFLHGFGLSNIKKTVAKYDGQCTTKDENEAFVLKIIIPIP
jgi:hypothetical protein